MASVINFVVWHGIYFSLTEAFVTEQVNPNLFKRVNFLSKTTDNHVCLEYLQTTSVK